MPKASTPEMSPHFSIEHQHLLDDFINDKLQLLIKNDSVAKLYIPTPSPLRGTPSINRGRVKIPSIFGKKL